MTRFLPAALAGLLALQQQGALAQNDVSVSTTIAVTVETVIPLAPGPEVNPGGPIKNATCTPDTLSCPDCEGQHVTDSTGAEYEAHCSSYISSSAVSNQPSLMTPDECLLACDGFFGCTGAYITDDGNCTLAIGALFGTMILEGSTAFVSMGDTIETIGTANTPSVSGAPASTEVSSGTPAPYANITSTAALLPPLPIGTGPVPLNTSWPSVNASTYNVTAPYPIPANLSASRSSSTILWAIATAPVHPPYPNATSVANITSSHNTSCSINNLSCPACNNQTVTDLYNTTYTVLCDTSLTSTSQYAFAEPLPASYCMAQCDERKSTCVGAYWANEECTLALGTYHDTLVNPGCIAFLGQAVAWPTITSLPVPAPTTVPTWLNMSAYNTGPYGSAATGLIGTVTSSISTETITSTYGGFLPGETCDPQAIACPGCDGLVLVDGLNSTYRVQCNFAPSCDDSLGLYGSYSLNGCMERCDGDATCLAAIYNDHQCDLCQRGMEGTYDESADYLVLLAEALPVSTAVSVTATVSSLTSVLATTFSNATSLTFAPLTVPSTSLISIHTAPGLPNPLSTVRGSSASVFNPSTSIPAPPTNATVSPSPPSLAACPGSDGHTFEVASGEYVASCNNGFGAASQRSTNALGIETCADQCTGDCGGVQWNEESDSCLLFTSIGVLASSAGWTAGIRVLAAPSPPASIVLVTPTSVSDSFALTPTSESVLLPYTGPPPGLFPTFSFSPSPSTSTALFTVTLTRVSLSTAIPIVEPNLSTDLGSFATSTTLEAAASTAVPVGASAPYNGPPKQHGAQHGGSPQGGAWFPWFGRRMLW